LSFVICPSVWPFDHGWVIAAATTTWSVAMPLPDALAKGCEHAMCGVGYPGRQSIGITRAQHPMEALD
jgi:hypothetical protein